MAAGEDWLRRFVLLAAGIGARTEALRKLTRFQIDVGARLVRLNPPGRKRTRKVRPTVRLAERLVRSWKARPRPASSAGA